jgi:Xaa-Pro aminopeptidase
MKNRRRVVPGEVVVVDAGAEYQGYAADVTRTLPVSGTYSAEQRAIYQLVRDAQAAAERNSKVGMSLAAAHDSSIVVRARGLAALGLIESPVATYDPAWPVDCQKTPRACQQVTLFTIHGISHGLGLEVHDPTQADTDDVLRVGDAFVIVRPMVERYANTGVRIEDAYLITDRGLEWISRVPRELEEVEALTRRRAPVP